MAAIFRDFRYSLRSLRRSPIFLGVAVLSPRPWNRGEHGNLHAHPRAHFAAWGRKERSVVFPGSGNHFEGMGMEISSRWPELFRRQDAANQFLRSQFRPELFWNDAPPATIDNRPPGRHFRAGCSGCATSDMVRSFGIQPQAVIGYSLGESAGLFALQAWRDRDGMLERMERSTLFTRDLAGECRAAASVWGFEEGRTIQWVIGVVEAPAAKSAPRPPDDAPGCIS